MIFVDPRESVVTELHSAYQAGQLRILVGNGLSIGSELPSWDRLNQRLLHTLIDSDARQGNNVWASALEPQIQLIRDQLYDVIGRDAAADFVRSAKPDVFYPALARALYNNEPMEALTPTAAHEQLAAMSGRSRIFTTNFDPLIELAMARVKGQPESWRSYRVLPEAADSAAADRVEHLHGWLDPDGSSGGKIILTEADYFELAQNDDAPANVRLRDLLSRPGAALVVGMSMADINIRRLLYLQSRKPGTQPAGVYLVLKERQRLVDQYTQRYWEEQRSLRLIFVKDYEEIPALLRDIQWPPAGLNALPGWIRSSQEWREQQCPRALLFSDGWQALAHGAMRTLARQIRRLFAVPSEERFHLALFVPLSVPSGDVCLSLVLTSRRGRTGAEAEAFAARRQLDIRKGHEQGLAALAFTRGLERESLYGNDGPDYNFTPEMRNNWVNDEGYRDWRSVLAVPWVASPQRVPVAVMTITSNLVEPFWTRFPTEDFREELLESTRRTTRWVLGGFR